MEEEFLFGLKKYTIHLRSLQDTEITVNKFRSWQRGTEVNSQNEIMKKQLVGENNMIYYNNYRYYTYRLRKENGFLKMCVVTNTACL